MKWFYSTHTFTHSLCREAISFRQKLHFSYIIIYYYNYMIVKPPLLTSITSLFFRHCIYTNLRKRPPKTHLKSFLNHRLCRLGPPAEPSLRYPFCVYPASICYSILKKFDHWEKFVPLEENLKVADGMSVNYKNLCFEGLEEILGAMRIQQFLVLIFFFGFNEKLMAMAFTGTYGINYGRIADNIPSPDKVVTLLRAAKIKNVRIYDADHSVLNAFKGTGLELVIGLPNGNVKEMSANADHALTWVKDNVMAFLPETHIVGIAIGNEVLGNDNDLSGSLLGAVKNMYNATKKLGIDDVVQISTAHSQAVFTNSYPPSSCTFKEGVMQFMKPLLEFFTQIGSPFCLNAYPFLAYTYNPDTIDINYALFQPTDGIYDEKTDLHYDNMLDAQIDAAYVALEDAGFKKMEVIITETGWASHGDQSEPAATLSNARTYNYNLRKRLAKRKGTPLRPKMVLKAYIFALFNENSKPGAGSEKYYGLFKADGSISYDIGFSGLKSSSAVSSRLSLKELRAGKLLESHTLVLAASITVLLLLLRL